MTDRPSPEGPAPQLRWIQPTGESVVRMREALAAFEQWADAIIPTLDGEMGDFGRDRIAQSQKARSVRAAAPSEPPRPDNPAHRHEEPCAFDPECPDRSLLHKKQSLDVERLAEAMHKVWPSHTEGQSGTGDPPEDGWRHWTILDPTVPTPQLIAAIAAEYARLHESGSPGDDR